MIARGRGRVVDLHSSGAATSFPNGSGYATSEAGLLRLADRQRSARRRRRAGVRHGSGIGATAIDEYQLNSEAGRAYLDAIPKLFAAGVDVPPTFTAHLSMRNRIGPLDKLAGRMLMAARSDLDLDEARIDAMVAADLRSPARRRSPDAARAATERSG